MEFIQQAIPELFLIKPKVFGDERGFFLETFRQSEFEAFCGNYQFVQDNHSKSKQGILRGLHYQLKQPQGKLVRVVSGCVYDVAVDMRKNSSTFGQWCGAELSAENKHLFWVPPGFAHGFYVLSDEAEFVYKCTDYYAPEHEVSLLWEDAALNINWPLIEGLQPNLSEKDAKAFTFDKAPVFD